MRLIPGSFVDEQLRQRHSDLLFEVATVFGKMFVYLLLEHQSYNHPRMPLRAYWYMGGIWSRFEHDHPSGPLVPSFELEFRANLHERAPRAERDVMTLAEQWFQEGEAKGRAEGRAEGEASLLTRLLTLKFGPLPEAYQARLASATVADLDAWAERVLFATSLAQVFGST